MLENIDRSRVGISTSHWNFLKFGSLENMRITSSEPEDHLGISGKGLITSLGIKAKFRPNKYLKARYAIVNVGMKDLSNIIR